MNHNEHSADAIRTLDLLRLPLIAGVVLIHSNYLEALPEGCGNVSTAFSGFMDIWKYVLSLCVPAFFFISGYFFYRSGIPRPRELKAKFQRRFHTLMIPYLLWNLIGLLCLLIKTSPWLCSYFPQYSDVFNPWWRVLTNFYCLPDIGYPYDFVLWFIRNLMVIVLLTPLLNMLFKMMKLWSLIPICIVASLNCDLLGLQFTLWFFSLGGLVAIYSPDLKFISRHRLLWLSLFIAMVAADRLKFIDLPAWIYETVGIFTVVSLSEALAKRGVKWPPFLVKSTFFVYAFHGLFTTVAQKSVLAVTAPFISGLMGAFATYLMIFLLLYGISLAACTIMRAYFPYVTGLLTGNRS